GKSGPSAMSGKSGPSAMGMGMGMGMYGVAPQQSCSDEVGDADLHALTINCVVQRAPLDCAFVGAIDGGCDGFSAYKETFPFTQDTISLEINSGLVSPPFIPNPQTWCTLPESLANFSHGPNVDYSAADMQKKCSCSCPA
ncbi:hypothetical protein TeGR_g695, partial [Tetraparma gracilis]